MKLRDFKKRVAKKNLFYFWCRFCGKNIFSTTIYQTDNLISMCRDCYENLKEEIGLDGEVKI